MLVWASLVRLRFKVWKHWLHKLCRLLFQKCRCCSFTVLSSHGEFSLSRLCAKLWLTKKTLVKTLTKYQLLNFLLPLLLHAQLFSLLLSSIFIPGSSLHIHLRLYTSSLPTASYPPLQNNFSIALFQYAFIHSLPVHHRQPVLAALYSPFCPKSTLSSVSFSYSLFTPLSLYLSSLLLQILFQFSIYTLPLSQSANAISLSHFLPSLYKYPSTFSSHFYFSKAVPLHSFHLFR